MSVDSMTPVDWYTLWHTDGWTLQCLLSNYAMLEDPKLSSQIENGKTFLRMNYSGFRQHSSYKDALTEARELASALTGTLRIRQDPPGNLILHRLVGLLSNGVEQDAPQADAVRFGIAYTVGGIPTVSIEQKMMEYYVRSKDSLVRDVLLLLSEEPTFAGLFKIIEVIRWDLGTGNMARGYKKIIERKWITEEKLKAFSFTANKVERHWLHLRPPAQMDLQEARINIGIVIEEWVAERAKMRLSVPRRGMTVSI